jgi:hypothetical protein
MVRIIIDLPLVDGMPSMRLGGWHAEHALVNYRLQDGKLHAIWWMAASPSPSHLPQILLRFEIAQLGVRL